MYAELVARLVASRCMHGGWWTGAVWFLDPCRSPIGTLLVSGGWKNRNVSRWVHNVRWWTEFCDSPRVRKNEEQTAQIENSEKVTSAELTLYRSLVMKLAYVAQDRIDITEAVKCLTRHMKEPQWTHARRTQEVRSIPGEQQEMRVDVCTTNVGCKVAGACGL